MKTMRRLCWFLLILLAGLPAAAVPGQRGFFPPEKVADSEWVKKMAIGDFNADGRPDFATLAWEIDSRCEIAGVRYEKGYLVRVHLNTTVPGAQTPTFAPALELPYVDGASRIYDLWTSDLTAADVNRDGRDDILVANTHSDRVHTYLSTGAGFAPRLESPAEDDPTYLAVADFDADSLPDVALLHFQRNVRSKDYHWKFSFLLGDGTGRFETVVVEDLGAADFRFDHGPHYNTSSFQIAGAPGGKRLGPMLLRDVVYMNGGLKWLSGTSMMSVVSEGEDPKATFENWGFTLLQRPGRPTPLLADVGGRLLLGLRDRLGDSILARYDSSLATRFLRADGKPGRIDLFGHALALHDFDQDGLEDLALLSQEFLPDRPEQNSRSILVAYGDSLASHPMSFAASSVPFVDRFKLLDNQSGLWGRGSKAGTLLAGDFNGDSYPDLLTAAESGILVHSGFGLFALDTFAPEIHQHRGIHPAGNFEGQAITLQGLFSAHRFKVGSVFFTPVGAPREKINLVGTLDPRDGSFSFRIPPEDVVAPGDYILSVYNGTAESKRVNPAIKIKLRPLELRSFQAEDPPAGSTLFPVKVSGWFGRNLVDQKRNRVTFTLPGRSEVEINARFLDLRTMILDLPVVGKDTFQIVVRHPGRESLSFSLPVDHRPGIETVRWENPDGTLGDSRHADPVPIRPGLVSNELGPFTVEKGSSSATER